MPEADEPPAGRETDAPPDPVRLKTQTLLFPGEDVLAAQSKIEDTLGPLELRQIVNSLPPFEIEIVGIGEDFVAFDSVEDFTEYGMDQRGTVVKYVAPSEEDHKSHAQFIRLMREISTPTQEWYFGNGPVESAQIIDFMDNDERRKPMPGWVFVEFRLSEDSTLPKLFDVESNAYKPRGEPPVVTFELPEEAISQTLQIVFESSAFSFRFADLVTHRLLKSPEFLSQ